MAGVRCVLEMWLRGLAEGGMACGGVRKGWDTGEPYDCGLGAVCAELGTAGTGEGPRGAGAHRHRGRGLRRHPVSTAR